MSDQMNAVPIPRLPSDVRRVVRRLLAWSRPEKNAYVPTRIPAGSVWKDVEDVAPEDVDKAPPSLRMLCWDGDALRIVVPAVVLQFNGYWMELQLFRVEDGHVLRDLGFWTGWDATLVVR
ncbi:hypothetical protein CERSUDRAFT_96584 [Gelatoporia subvermispora B]|uniref:Uncharacterized protein n=1 Tax=Ceriporiopsis subvermispora (strain B) TaxID=914234 RepID=M2QEJ5_CERS8|nr:hypothetical protein CERSUDRAFT_96584 [Gelatoporia subvermispora B]